MNDIYLYENTNVLKNLLDIHNNEELDIAEAELSRANMMLLYEKGFDDFFVEHYGYYFDQLLMSESAGYVRDAFVMACLGENSEYEHLEKILLDAICSESIDYSESEDADNEQENNKYEKYKTDYVPTRHEYIE